MSSGTVRKSGTVHGLGEVNGNSLQYSCLENPTDRAAWWATVHGAAKNQTRLNDEATKHMDLRHESFAGNLDLSPKPGGLSGQFYNLLLPH